jgi:hypothetical protein
MPEALLEDLDNEMSPVRAELGLETLGSDILVKTFEHLTGHDVARLACACVALNRAARVAALWQHLLKRDFAGLPGLPRVPTGVLSLDEGRTRWQACHTIMRMESVR